MANKKSNAPLRLNKRKAERFTCTMDISTEISYGRNDPYLQTGGSGYLNIPGPEKQKAKVIDLSLGGARLLAKSPINVDTPISIRLETFPEVLIMEGKAKVVWWKKIESELADCLLGIAFQNLKWHQRFRLKKLIKRLSREP